MEVQALAALGMFSNEDSACYNLLFCLMDVD